MEESILDKYSKSNKDSNSSGKKKLPLLILGIVILVVLINGVYFYAQGRKGKSFLPESKSSTAIQKEVKDIIAKVGNLIELPKNETPTIATVSDKQKLLDQAFFANAENGDKVLIYTNAKKAILYRPSANKIIEVSVLNFGTNPTPAAVPTATTSVSIPTPTPTLEQSPVPTLPQGPNYRP